MTRTRLHQANIIQWLSSALLCSSLGCASKPVEEPHVAVPARAPLQGELLISQLYTSGAAPAGGTDHYYSDQFIELVNGTPDPLDLSGIRVADVFGSAGRINPGMAPDSFRVPSGGGGDVDHLAYPGWGTS